MESLRKAAQDAAEHSPPVLQPFYQEVDRRLPVEAKKPDAAPVGGGGT